MAVPEFDRVAASRLVLRRLRPEDLEALVAYRNDPEVNRFQSWSDYDAERGRTLIESMRERQPGQPGWFQFAIALKDTDALVGDCALRTDDDPRLGEIGFTLSRRHQGKGLGTEAVRTLLGYAFDTLRMHRVIAVTDVKNTASAKVLERVGMRREGHFIEDGWFKGAWCDDYLYAMLGREWARATAR
ncbi:GNAT family N-acetyltransferase [Pyxidicoccus fallax]|uniref:GNAT family N-acetyltransferase n=1 Tax=Pyxidicoccus fallax TaxID=394095 RepID=A0A848LR49_9BACT|nr:GNAT family protein [Pyxidicoccus fallax]NMO20122.1 GNAT family N-acetyltransferase [Pyxidicoccus fallax]NPC80837.1 GNAT family N-acetyltransferase [Pyxidicoccus fallax]